MASKFRVVHEERHWYLFTVLHDVVCQKTEFLDYTCVHVFGSR